MRELDRDLWVCERPLTVAAGLIHVGARMTVIRLADGSLFVHSPLEPTPEIRAALDSLGPVRHLVAPNKVHHFWAAAAREAHPGSRLYAAPGLREKRPEIPVDEVLGDEAPPAWVGQIEQVFVAGVPAVNEVVFFHPATRTLLLTDLGFNITQSPSLATRLWFRAAGAYGGFGVGRYVRLLFRDREAARGSFERILTWDFDRVIVSHGIVLQRGGRRKLRETYAWLLDRS